MILKVSIFKLWLICLGWSFVYGQLSLNQDFIASGNGTLPPLKVITDFLSKILLPIAKAKEPPKRNVTADVLLQTVSKKVTELKPLLQDTERTELDKLKDLGSDETTILELIPPSVQDKMMRSQHKVGEYERNIATYGKLKKKIYKALDKEPISYETRKMITQAMDVLVAQIIKSQCSWQTVEERAMFKEDPLMIEQQKRNVDSTMKLAKHWVNKWDTLKGRYSRVLKSHPDVKPKEMIDFVENFNTFFKFVISDVKKISKNYKIRCHFVSKNSSAVVLESAALRQPQEDFEMLSDIQNQCKGVKFCTEELSSFMLIFYNSLNETAIGVLTNSASTLNKDSSLSSTEGDSAVITKLKNYTSHKANKLYRDEVAKLQLDNKKSSDSNIKIITKFIENTTNRVKEHLLRKLKKVIKSTSEETKIWLTNDVKVNSEVDFNNLKRDFVSRICTHFSLCNGKLIRRRFDGGQAHMKPHSDIYVKLQVSLDTENKDNKTEKSNGNKNELTGRIFDDDMLRLLNKGNSGERGSEINRINNYTNTMKNIMLTRTSYAPKGNKEVENNLI